VVLARCLHVLCCRITETVKKHSSETIASMAVLFAAVCGVGTPHGCRPHLC
jgi:hypothetical protein